MNVIVEQQPDIVVSRAGSLGRIVLDRPKALNALTLGMVRAMDAALDAFAADAGIAAVLLSGAGERGLCAGGDIRAIYDSGKAGSPLAEAFWREEYRLNARISHFPKPYIALMDGIVMGGGVGLSAHGSHRIVTDATRLAMPETGIGFFPDVGATWLLSQPGGEFGTYLGLTGSQIGADDAIAAGFADWHVPRADLETLVEALSALPADADAGRVGETITAMAQAPAGGATPDMRAVIDRAFRHDTVAAILAALKSESGAFSAATHDLLLSKSPTSLKVTLRLLRAGRQSPDLETCLAREFAATPAVLASHDFYEGVRAAVIDKDHNPKWAPSSLDAVDDAVVGRYFPPHPHPLF